MPRRRDGESGFTLLEVLVVVTIVAVLAGVIVPTLGGSRGRDLTDTAHRMTLLINHARQEAALSSQVWRLVLEPGAGRFRFHQRTGGDFEPVRRDPLGGKHRTPGIEWGRLTVSGQGAAGSAEVYLYPTGEQDPFRLTLRAGRKERTVVMDPVGRARVENGD